MQMMTMMMMMMMMMMIQVSVLLNHSALKFLIQGYLSSFFFFFIIFAEIHFFSLLLQFQ